MVFYLVSLGLMSLLLAALYLVFRISAQAYRGQEEYSALVHLTRAIWVLLINYLAHIVTVLMLYLENPYLHLWLIVATTVVGIGLLMVTGLLFELLGGSIKCGLHHIWQSIGDYLDDG